MTEYKTPMKIHSFGCKCNFYKKKVPLGDKILVAPGYCDFSTRCSNDFSEIQNQQYWLYSTLNELTKDIEAGKYSNNCMCTHSKNTYHGGIIMINMTDGFSSFKNTNELKNIRFVSTKDAINVRDKSNLINLFCEYVSEISEGIDILIGSHVSTNDEMTDFCSFPKGKLMFGETTKMCANREFEEETGVKIPDLIWTNEYQTEQRTMFKLAYNFNIPFEIKINNFIMFILIV